MQRFKKSEAILFIPRLQKKFKRERAGLINKQKSVLLRELLSKPILLNNDYKKNKQNPL